jgi:hypothetical protein
MSWGCGSASGMTGSLQKFTATSRAKPRQEGHMTTECSALPAMSLGQRARDKASRRLSTLALGKDMLIVLAGTGLVLSLGSSALDLLALK